MPTPSPARLTVAFAVGDWAVRARDEDGFPTHGGSGWIRVGQIAEELRRLGHDVREGVLAAKNGRLGVQTWDHVYRSQRGGEAIVDVEADLVVLQRWMVDDVAERIRTARRRGQVVVNDVDDDFWDLDPRNQAFFASHPLRNPIENRDHYLRALQASDAITVSTGYLADRMRRLCPKVPVYLLPNAVRLDDYPIGNLRRPEGPPSIGWAGGIPWRSGDVETLRGILGPFVEANDLRVVHLGAVEAGPRFAELAGVDPARVEERPLVPTAEYPAALAGLDAGLVPLRPCGFNRAKSWIKGAEYAAAGVPFVAEALPEYVNLHALGIGRIADRPKGWIGHLRRLLDPDVRAEDQERNRNAVAALDVRRRAPDWVALYRDLGS